RRGVDHGACVARRLRACRRAGHRRITLGNADRPDALIADVLQGSAADSAEELSELPSSRPDRAVLAVDVREHTPVGKEHQDEGGITADAALVRRLAPW